MCHAHWQVGPSHLTVLSGKYHCLHLTDEETGVERLSDLCKVLQLVGDGQDWAVLAPGPVILARASWVSSLIKKAKMEASPSLRNHLSAKNGCPPVGFCEGPHTRLLKWLWKKPEDVGFLNFSVPNPLLGQRTVDTKIIIEGRWCIERV